LLQGRVHRLEALIEGILTFSRVGRIRRELETVDTGALVGEVIDLLSPPPETTIEVQPGMPALQAERLLLQQVFMNLIGNALKHGSSGCSEPKIGIAWQEAGDAVEFAVSDNGPGIAPEYHERIWGIFQTLASRDKVEGTGVGLALVKRIVDRRGGRVSVESAVDQGATFRFIWPKTPHDGGNP
jgi:signal transduction histidine kinase